MFEVAHSTGSVSGVSTTADQKLRATGMCVWRVGDPNGSAGEGGCAVARGKYVTDDGISNDIDVIFRSKGASE